MTRKPNPAGASDVDLYRDWIDHLKNASQDRIVLVHHKHDKDVLEGLGVKNIMYYKEPETQLIEDIVAQGKECILLFDAHRPTNTLCEHLRSELEKQGVKVSTRFRKVLFTGKMKELGGLLKFLNEQVGSERTRSSLS